MRKLLPAIASTMAIACLLTPASRVVANASPQEAGRELGAVLGWRLGPEVVEEHCRSLDPEGVQVRREALESWQKKNAALIQQVDARVAEVIALLPPPVPGKEPVKVIHDQIRVIYIESVFGEKTPAEAAALCKSEADPVDSRWNNNGLPHVQQSLAALKDWQFRRSNGH